MTDAATLTATPGEATRVASVENALNSLWQQIAGEDFKQPVLRATTLNLVLFTDSADATAELIGQLSETHPSRAIVVEMKTADHVQPASLVAVPTLFCRPSLGAEARKQVCCEEIVLRAGSKAVDRIPGAIQGLLLADLPVYIFWQGNVSLSNKLLTSLGEVIDGLIVDSANFDETSGLSDLVAFMKAPHLHGAIYDLNWQRILFWRGAVAQSFDGQQDRSALQTIRDVEITHNKAYIQAMLFVSWLASRLDWQLVPGDQPNTWIGERGQTIHINATTKGEIGLQSVHISAETHTYTVELANEAHLIHTSNGRTRAFQLPAENTGSLTGAIIDTSGHDSVFEAALTVAAELLKLKGNIASQQPGLIVTKDATSLAQAAARYFIFLSKQSINQRGLFTVALSGGSTPKALFNLLAQASYAKQVDWDKVHVFWGDERNVPIENADSNQRIAREALLDKVPIPDANIHGVLTGKLSADEAALRYAGEIRAFFKGDILPSFDLILLGLGDDGHTASLFPHSPALSADDKQIFVANPVEKLNTTRLTLTVGVINNADNVIFLVSGAGKADVLHILLEEPSQPDDYPSQRIQPTHGTLLILADQDAASKLHDD